MLQHAMSFTIHFHGQEPPLEDVALSQAPTWSFKDPGIRQTFLNYFFNLTHNIGKEDIERPSKRARLSAVDIKDSSLDVRSNVMDKVSHLLGVQENPKLASLSQIAV